MHDYQAIIVWKNSNELLKLIEENFKNKILYKESIHIDLKKRKNLINQLYYPVVPPSNDPRFSLNEDITLYIIKLDPVFHFQWRTEGYRLCNSEILEFKLSTRKKFDYTFFHCSDNITEAKKSLNVFDVKFDLANSIIDMGHIYHFIHGDSTSHTDCYANKNFKIVPIKNSPVVKYLQNYKKEYISGSKLFYPRESTIAFQALNAKQGDEIPAIKYKDKYILCDGMHRSSALYFNGDRDLYIRCIEENSLEFQQLAPFFPYITDNSFSEVEENSHLENIHEIIFRLNDKNIRWMAIRGFKTMPHTADTDLDIVIHPDDYANYLSVINSLIKENRVAVNVEKKYLPNLWYRSYKTLGTRGDFITNNSYQIDSYSSVFFFGKNDAGIELDRSFIDAMFSTCKKMRHINIPNIYEELVLLVGRTFIDRSGNWSEKHKTRAKEIMSLSDFDINKYKKLLHMAFGKSMPGILSVNIKL